jgi:tetrahydromethanopterin S-methyltransferase subunit G
MQDDGAFYGIVVALTVVALAIIVIAGTVEVGVSVFSN